MTAVAWRPEEYGGPVLVSLLLHVVIIVLLAMNLSFCERDVVMPAPKHVRAVVLEMPQSRPPVVLPERKVVEPVIAPPLPVEIPRIELPKLQPEPKSVQKPDVKPLNPVVKPVEPLPQEKPKPPPPDFSALLAQEEKTLATREALRRDAADQNSRTQADLSARALQDQKQVDEYKALIAAEIQRRWAQPPGARAGMFADFRITLLPGGDLRDIKLLKSSGNPAFDKAAENAVRLAGRLPVPADAALFSANFRQFTFRFRPEDVKP